MPKAPDRKKEAGAALISQGHGKASSFLGRELGENLQKQEEVVRRVLGPSSLVK